MRALWDLLKASQCGCKNPPEHSVHSVTPVDPDSLLLLEIEHVADF